MDERIERLEDEIARLRAEVAELRSASPPPGDEHTASERPRSRRAMITGATAAGVGAAASLLIAKPAAADDPNDIALGETKNTNQPTEAIYTGGPVPEAGFHFNANQPQPPVIPAGLSAPNAALLGSGASQMANGVEGTTNNPNGVGVFAHNYAGGNALEAETSDATAVRGRALGTTGVGVVGTGQNGTAGLGAGTDPVTTAGVTGFGASGLAGIGFYGVRLFGELAAVWLAPTTTTKDPPPARTDAHRRGEIDVDDNGDLWYCTADGTPGTWRKMSGPLTGGALHFLASLVRIYDSRPGATPPTGPKARINPGEGRTIDCTLNGSGVPSTATGVIATLTVADAGGRGNLAMYPDGQAPPTASTINYTPGVNIANTTIVGCGPGARLQVRCGGASGCNFLIDIAGYFT